MKLFILLILMVGCTNIKPLPKEVVRPEQVNKTCHQTAFFDFEDPILEEDKPHIELAYEGCKRKYTKKHCLVVLTKLRRLTYHGICRKDID